jgi:hypothetical protein
MSNNWIFLNKVDSFGADIIYIPVRDNKFLSQYSDSLLPCIAFNTLGYLKRNITLPLTKSPHFLDYDGLFIKKSYYEQVIKPTIKKVRVKLLCNWCSSQDLCKDWNRMSQDNNYCWNNIEITWENSNIDFYVIINKPQKNDFYIPERTIIFHMEPRCDNSLHNWGVKTWGEWENPDENIFLHVRTISKYPMIAYWQLSTNYNDFYIKNIIKKYDYISSICSSKYFDPGHIKRIDFINYVESKNDDIVKIDIFGYKNFHNFKNYRGQTVVHKEEGMEKYKYYFMTENNSEYNYATEKIYEPILMECLCFYWGCPNLSDWINPKAYIILDLDDFEKSFNIIKQSIEKNLWEERLEIIKEEKNKILEKYMFFPTLENILFEQFNFSLNPSLEEIKNKKEKYNKNN